MFPGRLTALSVLPLAGEGNRAGIHSVKVCEARPRDGDKACKGFTVGFIIMKRVAIEMEA